MNRKHKEEESRRKPETESTIADSAENKVEESPNSTTTEPMVGSPTEETPSSAEEQIRDLNDKYLRLYSEFDNFRKRTIREKNELRSYATADLIEKLLPVLDDFDRANKATDSADDVCKPIKEGILLIYNKLNLILSQQGLQPMRTVGETFDTDFHEAITHIPAPKPELKGKIIDEVEKGYLLNGKVVRFAKVVVGG